MTVLVETSGGLVRHLEDGTWVVESGIDVTRFSTPGEAVIALSNHCEMWTSGSECSVDYKIDLEEIQGMVEAASGEELFPSSDDGWILRNGWWLPACVEPGYGDAENVATLVTDVGEMGVHVELFDYDGIYFLRWNVVDHDDDGLEVLGTISEAEALHLAEEKADELGGGHGLQTPFAIGLANLEEDERFELQSDAELAAHASTAWPYDPSVTETVSVHRRHSAGESEWLVTSKGERTVLGQYSSWQAIEDAFYAPDGWEIEVDWIIEALEP